MYLPTTKKGTSYIKTRNSLYNKPTIIKNDKLPDLLDKKCQLIKKRVIETTESLADQ